MEDKVRVFVIESHALVRQSLIAVLQQFADLEIVGEAEDSESGIALVGQLLPDVTLLSLIELSSVIETTKLLRQNYPNSQVIIVSSFREYGHIREAFKAGAINYVLNDTTADDMAQAIRQAHFGKTSLAPEAVSALLSSIYRERSKKTILGKRERQVLELMVQGLDNKEIASQLDVSRSTVKNHVNSLFAKLNVNSRVKAVTVALQNKLLDEP